MQVTQTTQFYPSHLFKGLVAGGVSLTAGAIALIMGGYAMRELSLVGQDKYPEVKVMLAQ